MADELRIGLPELLRKAHTRRRGIPQGRRPGALAGTHGDGGRGAHRRRPPRADRGAAATATVQGKDLGDAGGSDRAQGAQGEGSSYFPSLLEPRRRAERALSAVVQEAYVHGVSTRKVDELVKALGMTGISKSRVSELCEELDEEVERFRNRELEGTYPYVWLDATYVKARQDGRVVSIAVVIAVGVNGETGEREILGVDVGPSEDGAFWTGFCAL